MEKIKVVICGREFNLKADEAPERIQRIADELDKRISELKNALRSKNDAEIITLVALNALDEADKQRVVGGAGNAENDKLKKMLIDTEAELTALKKKFEALEAVNKEHVETNEMLTEGIHSAESEMEQLANVKEDENSQLRQELQEYEHNFEKFSKEREEEIAKLRTTYESAQSEMEHLATVKEMENFKLRNTLNSYESTFDEYVKKKEAEVSELQDELLKVRGELEAYKKAASVKNA